MKQLVTLFAAGILSLAAIGCGGPTVEIEEPFQVIHSAPQHGGTGIAVDVVPSIGFSGPVNANTSHAVSLQKQGAAQFELISATIFIESDGYLITLLPNDFLEANTKYQIVATTEVRSSDDEPLLTRYRAEFVTASD